MRLLARRVACARFARGHRPGRIVELRVEQAEGHTFDRLVDVEAERRRNEQILDAAVHGLFGVRHGLGLNEREQRGDRLIDARLAVERLDGEAGEMGPAVLVASRAVGQRRF